MQDQVATHLLIYQSLEYISRKKVNERLFDKIEVCAGSSHKIYLQIVGIVNRVYYFDGEKIDLSV